MYKRQVSALTEALAAEPVCDWKGKKVILTGITCEPDEVLGYFADNNVAVVGDDLAQESRQYRSDYPCLLYTSFCRADSQWWQNK